MKTNSMESDPIDYFDRPIMPNLTRRDLVKSGLLVGTAVLAPKRLVEALVAEHGATTLAATPRERLLLPLVAPR